MSTRTEATIEDLYRVHEDGKAEIVDGEILLMSPTGDLPSSAALEIVVSLREYGRRTQLGRAYAAFYIGPRAGGKFLTGVSFLMDRYPGGRCRLMIYSFDC